MLMSETAWISLFSYMTGCCFLICTAWVITTFVKAVRGYYDN